MDMSKKKNLMDLKGCFNYENYYLKLKNVFQIFKLFLNSEKFHLNLKFDI